MSMEKNVENLEPNLLRNAIKPEDLLLDLSLKKHFAEDPAVSERLDIQIEAFQNSSTQEQLFCYLWKKDLRLVDESFMDLIGDNDILEIYDVENFKQVFANRVFFTFSNYEPETLMKYSFTQLYKRDQKYNSDILANASKCLHTGKIEKYSTPAHYITEYAFGESDRYRLHLKYLCPIKDLSGNLVQVASTNFCLKV